MRPICFLALSLALSGCAAWDEDFSTMRRTDSVAVPYEVQTSRTAVVRDLDARRKVADVDCSKPFDPTLGNVRCR